MANQTPNPVEFCSRIIRFSWSKRYITSPVLTMKRYYSGLWIGIPFYFFILRAVNSKSFTAYLLQPPSFVVLICWFTDADRSKNLP